MGKYIINITITSLLLVSAGSAVDFTLAGKLNGRLYYDMDDGSVDSAKVAGDADPVFITRYRADVFLLSDLGNDCYGNLGITLDDADLDPAFDYALELNPYGNYYVDSPESSRDIYAKLYEVNFTKLNAVAGMDLTAGGFKIRYGDGGYYNDLMNGIEPHPFIAKLDPYGIRARRDIGPVYSEFAFGVDGGGALIAATAQTVGPVTFYVASEGRAYSVRGLWDIQFLSAMSDFWLINMVRSGLFSAPVTYTSGSDLSMAQHIGAEADINFGMFNIYPVFVYHRFADNDNVSSTTPSGGMLLQFYSEFSAGFTDEFAIRAAMLYEYWKANEFNVWNNGDDNNADLMLWIEPQLTLFDDLTVGGNVRYKNPNMKPYGDNPFTFYNDEITNSIGYGPHVVWRPVEAAALDATYTYNKWDPSYDEYGNDDIDTSIENKVKLEIEVAF
ncbi:MAG: hypothetical protein GY771_02660 [bacterium]|nr:hypothetical protein [bacterium]